MKIRVDFVTNSSSSSFTLIVKFTMRNGKSITWKGHGDDGEDGYEYVDLTAMKSPRELAQASSMNELISMLDESIVSSGWGGEQESVGVGDQLEPKLKKYNIDKIKSIEITGKEDNYKRYYRTYIYDTETGIYLLKQTGDPFEKNGGSGGDLSFCDNAFLNNIERT